MYLLNFNRGKSLESIHSRRLPWYQVPVLLLEAVSEYLRTLLGRKSIMWYSRKLFPIQGVSSTCINNHKNNS